MNGEAGEDLEELEKAEKLYEIDVDVLARLMRRSRFLRDLAYFLYSPDLSNPKKIPYDLFLTYLMTDYRKSEREAKAIVRMLEASGLIAVRSSGKIVQVIKKKRKRGCKEVMCTDYEIAMNNECCEIVELSIAEIIPSDKLIAAYEIVESHIESQNS